MHTRQFSFCFGKVNLYLSCFSLISCFVFHSFKSFNESLNCPIKCRCSKVMSIQTRFDTIHSKYQSLLNGYASIQPDGVIEFRYELNSTAVNIVRLNDRNWIFNENLHINTSFRIKFPKTWLSMVQVWYALIYSGIQFHRPVNPSNFVLKHPLPTV